jgi:carbon-monoxide dehydrogenase small subunit
MRHKIQLVVNGRAVSREVDADRLLVQLLREDLALTGTHVGCDTAQCGACTVHVDGRAVKACSMLAVQADGARITTIEGLAANDGALHPMQAAFKECHGLQCGFCRPPSARGWRATCAAAPATRTSCGLCRPAHKR